MNDPLNIERQTAKLQGRKHVPELQAFRGLAALVVVVYHSMLYYAYSTGARHTFERVVNAHAAVVSFYVLSGYVLAGSIADGALDWPRTLAFYVRRLFRIYPALLVASCVGLAYIYAFHGHPLPASVSAWWPRAYREQYLPPLQIAEAFLAVGSPLPIFSWSIFVELLGSALVPLIVLVNARGRLPMLSLVAALALFSFLYGDRTRMGAGVYLLDFALGAAIPFFPRVFQWLGATHRRAAAVSVALLAMLLFVRALGGWDYDHSYNSPAAAALEAVAAWGLIGTIACRPAAFPLLRLRSTVWLGDISYSVYLFHLPLLAFIAALGGEVFKLSVFNSGPLVATVCLFLCTLLLTLPVSALSYRFIELPCLQLGKRAAKRF